MNKLKWNENKSIFFHAVAAGGGAPPHNWRSLSSFYQKLARQGRVFHNSPPPEGRSFMYRYMHTDVIIGVPDEPFGETNVQVWTVILSQTMTLPRIVLYSPCIHEYVYQES